jgi:hypothetical protein
MRVNDLYIVSKFGLSREFFEIVLQVASVGVWVWCVRA